MPKIEVALVYEDGRKEIVNVGRPKMLAAFGDKFKKASPELYGEMAWLAWATVMPGVGFDEWLDTLEDLDASDETVAAIRDELDGKPARKRKPGQQELDPTPPATSGEDG